MEIPRHWRLKQQRYQLRGVEYPCGHKDLSGAPVCRRCSADRRRFRELETSFIVGVVIYPTKTGEKEMTPEFAVRANKK